MDFKEFFNRPVYNTTKIVSKIITKFQKYLNKIEKNKEDKRWLNLFGNKQYFIHTFKEDIKINLYKSDYLSKRIYDGFEEEETSFIYDNLNEGDIFLDIGANVGVFTLIAAKKVGAKGKVVCFEPTPKIFNKLVENCKLNNFENVDYRNIGLSDKKEKLTFYTSNTGRDAFNSFAMQPNENLEKVEIQTSTLDTELENIEKGLIKIVKIDVEGWEKFVLNGGKSFFTSFSPIVMMEFTEENTFNAGYAVHELYDIMVDFGYKWHRIIDGQLVFETKKLYYPYNNLIAIKKL